MDLRNVLEVSVLVRCGSEGAGRGQTSVGNRWRELS